VIFERIRLLNYRQYRDVTIDLTPFDAKKGFFVFLGGNGAGKTNLMNAITWCLYGKEFNIRNEYRGLPKLNTLTLRDMEEGAKAPVKVEIEMRGPENEKIYISRTLEFEKRSGKAVGVPCPDGPTSEDGSKLEMYRYTGLDATPVMDPVYIVQQLMPEQIEHYFFFDGERLDDYFNETPEKIRDAVHRISQIDLLNRLIKHLEDRKKEYQKSCAKLVPEAEQAAEWLARLTKQQEEFEEKLRNLSAERREADQRIQEIREELKKWSRKEGEISQLLSRREELEKRKGELSAHIDQIRKAKLRFLVLDSAPKVLTYDALVKLANQIREREESGRIPPEYQKSFLERLLRRGECICGTDLEAKPSAREKIEGLLRSSDDLGEKSLDLIRLEGDANKLVSDVRTFQKRWSGFNYELERAEKEFEHVIRELDRIDQDVVHVPVEQVRELESRWQRWQSILRKIDGDMQLTRSQHEQIQVKIRAAEADYRKQLKKSNERRELVRRLEFCDEALEAAKRTRDELMNEIREELERKTQTQFLSLVWDKARYNRVLIDENYNVSVRDSSDLEAFGSLSAGEGTVLALAFMAAVNSVSGFDVPIIIDTLLGRISAHVRDLIAEKLPNFIPGKQVLLLMTDTEYQDSVRRLLAPRVGREFRIHSRSLDGMGVAAEVVRIE